MPGWYRGPSVATPRLSDRPYDLPPTDAQFEGISDMQWVDRPAAGSTRFLTVFLSDARPDLPAFPIREGDAVVGMLPMTNGWHLSLCSGEAPLDDHARAFVQDIRDEQRIGFARQPRPGSESAAIVVVTTSPEGPPLFIQIVLGSDNFYDDRAQAPA